MHHTTIYIGKKPALKMSYKEFVDKYKHGKVILFVDKLGATFFCMWVGCLGLIFSIILSFIYMRYSFVLGIIWCIRFINLSRKATSIDYILKECLKSKITYNLVIKRQWGYVLAKEEE